MPDDSSKINPGNTSKTEVSTSSTISSSKIGSSNKTRLPISILPNDPKEKQKHVIGLMLKQFSYLSLEYSESYGNRYEFNNSVSCPICNKDYKEESIWNNIKGK
ncbi:hypothetical protein RhiirC2_143152 [Rhizophagus irregularis]|uniref:Uncharacterized protein n=1 Tax=Rhizophagus irregularis TaxID=588596 RepID=A0A2N1MNT4_9GLOM|nr:hypothetical protein RhiirC2_143152 [Rhizophagus irregularis]